MSEKFEIRESVILENDDEKIFAVLHKPKKTYGKIPAVLFCHGFAGQKTGRHRAYVTIAEELAKSGIASLRLDFRGCGDSEGNLFQSSIRGQVKDALKGLEFLSECKEVDGASLGILGRSLGGAIAVMTAKQFGSIKSLALWAPVFSTKPWEKELSLINKQEPIIFNGELIGRAFLKDLFNMQLENDLLALNEVPLLHIHGDRDFVVNSDHKQNYQTCRMNAEAETLFLNLEKCDHEFSDVEERNKAISSTVAWFKSTLK